MLGNVEKHIAENLPFLKQSKLLIAISGGLDSVVLANLLYKLDFSIAFAHCNFQLRGEESNEDEVFVKTLGNSLKAGVFTKKFNTETYANEQKLSIQMAARALRYEWFQEIADKFQYDYILTAHHQDDMLETFLINLSRGTGIDGLTGIPQQNGNIVRPLLPFTQVDILAYAKNNNLLWREDSSNASTKYVRNKIRHDIVPLLKELHPTFMKNFQATQQHLQESNSIIKDAIQKLQAEIITEVSDGNYSIEIEAIQQQKFPKAYLFELLRDFGFHEWQDVKDLLNAQSGKQVFSAKYRLIKDRTQLFIQKRNQKEEVSEFLIQDSESIIKTPIRLQIEEVTRITDKGKNVLYIDKDLLKFPLTVRKWQNGDYFYPVGMKGKKKVSKYFKDEKYSLIDKENQWLLCNENDIIWIIGKRSDNRYKLTKLTKTIIKLTLQ
ncbi:tRNA lysidine(34) synthetase TilS [Kordia algicida OT-1]|uniref:tRNA(Ile)-lysidine synthase n=1 Tax=Kordia algicida OT-1 TaxID=391587 RepID=A9DXE3_9FLAO|nr:tRNA lysidine(34) synthetase TilS [Kordia algicida]EDP95993.1 tRNA(Ile)-lysidine synthetase [Kordia algicida OT-1]